MDEKTTQYINATIKTLTGQRNNALDTNVKLQAELAVANAEIAELNAKIAKEADETKTEAE
tara:strand:+ start:142 stop:324 length:183 start_codon:yes stop_codon:yes gene_type:complete